MEGMNRHNVEEENKQNVEEIVDVGVAGVKEKGDHEGGA